MATGVEGYSPPSPKSEMVAGGIALDFPSSDASAFSSPHRVPKRLRKRLLEEAKTPGSIEDIETKLRLADLRRQQFYEKLSCKARGKPRSPSRSSSQDEDLGQRLEAKLQAAEQKRLSILAKAQMRLAKLDELRQVAKTGVEIRFKREREKLGTEVELRVQQAEANRMLILKACKQRRATLKERTSLSMSRRMARESKYKEHVRAAIHQKRLSAEKKRLGLLEEEKKRAHARVLQVQQVAKFISHQREVQRRRMRDQLEDRLQRAKRQRAEYLSQRARQRNSIQLNLNRMQKQADFLSRKLARCWRKFLRLRRTTLDLAKDYDALKINESLVKSMPFEQLAHMIESTATIQTVNALLDRLENRLKFSKVVAAGNNPSGLDNIDHLLKRVATPKKRPTPRTSMRTIGAKKAGRSQEVSKSQAKLSRYPVKVVLCAYMILGHPDAVFSGQGEREIALAKSAEELIRELEVLIRTILDGPIQSSDEESVSRLERCTFRSQLAAFDKAWCAYLNCFVVWKVKDARLLEDNLVRAACQLELSMIQKCKITSGGENDTLTHDMKAIQKQVMDDQKLLREKVQRLSGNAGIERMECALSEMRSNYFQAKENGRPVGSPITHFLSTSTSISPAGTSSAATFGDRNNMIEGAERPSHVVRSLFREDGTSLPKGSGSSDRGISHLAGQLGSSVEKSITENERIVNEFFHEQRGFADRLGVTSEDQYDIKAKIRKTMEEAFWDGIMESLKEVEPDYDRVVQLVREVRDELSEMAPESWKQEIVEAIDLDILTQLLKSGNLDVGYLGKILEFALGTLQKLASVAHEAELKVKHQKLLKELTETCQTRDHSKFSHATAMVKGLRFVLEQIQALKQEISKGHIRMMEPLLKGPAGLDYLKKGFVNRYGSHEHACVSLPLTRQWLSSVRNCKDQEWEEYNNSLSALMSCASSSQVFLPSMTLRTGGSFPVKANGNGMTASAALNTTGGQQPEPGCQGEKIDLFVRLGLLQLVSAVSGLTSESLPETLLINLPRLRAVQAQIQKIIVISTSILIFRQALLMEQVIASSGDMEDIVSKCTKQLLQVLDQIDDVGIEEIVDVISGFSHNGTEKLQSRKLVMGRMLAKSLQAGDPVFKKVSRAVYLAARGVVLGGSGPQGRKLAEMALQQIGAVMLTERVVQAAEVLVVVATVSVRVHGPWYVNLIENM
uniref:Uncharacterized protein MANES_07G019200 n=2 Tax=Rhizophora mucronata TaxID=61149 RepID=A0A2P2LSL0_RHIMU